MKKLIISLTLLGLVCSFAHASGIFTSSKGDAVNVAISSVTSTAIWAAGTDVSHVVYDNQTGYDVYLSTFQITVSSLTLVSSVTNFACYPLHSSTSALKPQWGLDCSAFEYAISSATVAAMKGFWAIIER